ncbi:MULTISPECIES: nucleoid-associated protein [unclassified Paludibacterium]|uniref:nucleoid-associated protein n=1 Tax=unclassified Paludibacterium TaxID=2618429 RepID=UPI001C050BC9|nr:nucleoid-associated protein [Paludibacterium sp. B53371]BEV73094.1 hypothetical protein THUN1379_25760 [Paludibacterium sp. THUN1379]
MLIEQANVQCLAVHRVGNQSRGEVLQLSDRTPAVDEAVSGLLLNGYLKGIVSDKKKYQFFHETDLKLNEIYHYSRQFFHGELDFLEVSQRIARHLYARSTHPNISAGDLFVILFDGLSDGERNVRGLGVFKAEIREDFLSVVESGDVFDIRHASGINPRLIDKGALILEHGPIVYAIDRQGQQTKFWLDDFLKAMRVPDAVSKSRMVATAVQQISSDIEDPVQQAEFREACLELCEESQTVSPGQVMAVAGKFVPREQAAHAFDAAAESCGFVRDDHDALPAQGMAKRLERTLSKYGVGHGISLLLPAGITLKNIHSSADGEGEMTLTLKLRKRELAD